ncbi:hypothetical protein EV359DRAFT_69278, partial [Lentinula novae-zelandiae]
MFGEPNRSQHWMLSLYKLQIAESLRTSIDKDAANGEAIIAQILEQEAPAAGFNQNQFDRYSKFENGCARTLSDAINQYANVMRRSRLPLNNTESPSASVTHQAQRVIKRRPLQLQNGRRSRDNKGLMFPLQMIPMTKTSSKNIKSPQNALLPNPEFTSGSEGDIAVVDVDTTVEDIDHADAFSFVAPSWAQGATVGEIRESNLCIKSL